MCMVWMSTKDGGNCHVSVECKDSPKFTKEDSDWSLCYKDGRNCFKDDRIGEFCVTFTTKDGDEGEGLTGPVLEVPAVKGEIPVTDLATKWFYNEDDNCPYGNSGNGCVEGPWVCYMGDHWGRKRVWGCGVPKKDAKFPEEIKYEDLLEG